MANQLPTVVLDGVTYYIDHRLGQLREVDNPHNTRSIEDMYNDE